MKSFPEVMLTFLTGVVILTVLLFVGALLTSCAPDTEVVEVVQGSPGVAGAQGPAGATGQTGASCTVSRTNGGAVVRCTDGTQVFVADGKDGKDGKDGSNGSGCKNTGNCTCTKIIDHVCNNCTKIPSTSIYSKKVGNNYKLYTASSCSSSSAYAEVSPGSAYWAGSDILATWSTNSLRVIYF